jgi:polyhydroxybutyrate depolymerase
MAALALVPLGACGSGGASTTSTSDANPASPTSGAGSTGDSADPGADGSAAASDAPSSDAPSSVATSGCGLANVPTGMQSKMITVSGVSRHYQLLVPSTYDASRPTRLIFVFHGLGGDGDQIRAYFGFEAEAGGQALFVYPDGLVVPAQGTTGWAESDLAFFDAMVSEISASHCVDAKRIFAAGHSYGAYMSNLVGCERGDVVRAIAPVSGGLVAAAACKGPVAAWLAHGDMDTTVAQSEGIAARDHWIGANGCASTSKPTMPSPCVAYDGCSANHPVTWCSFSGGHFPLPAFTQQAIWDFFKVL